MYKNYFNIDDLNLTDIKKRYIIDKKYNAIELKFDSTAKHDVMSYGTHGGKYITNFDTLRYLALNPDKNNIERNIFNKQTNEYNKINGSLCMEKLLIECMNLKFVIYKSIYVSMFQIPHIKIIFNIWN